jgi:hypothetical protein
VAVQQYFEIELPFGSTVSDDDQVVTMSRLMAEEVYRDLHGALFPGGAFRGNHAPLDEDELFDDTGATQVTGTTVSPEEALARVQAMEQVQPSYQRNPGSGIGNG